MGCFHEFHIGRVGKQSKRSIGHSQIVTQHIFRHRVVWPGTKELLSQNLLFGVKGVAVSQNFTPKTEKVLLSAGLQKEIQCLGFNGGFAQKGYSHLVGFGDSWNDVPLFQACDEGYAVANASDELKQLAAAVILSNAEDGVAEFIKTNM